jgi:hypothetical protein
VLGIKPEGDDLSDGQTLLPVRGASHHLASWIYDAAVAQIKYLIGPGTADLIALHYPAVIFGRTGAAEEIKIALPKTRE